MINIRLITLLALLLSCTCYAEPQIYTKILTARAASAPTRDVYEQTAYRLEAQLTPDLPDLTTANGIEGAIAKLTGRPPEAIRLLSGDAAHGMSGNAIYSVSKDTSPYLLIKVFRAGKGEFGEELLALHTYGALGLKQFNIPKVRAMGQCSANGVRYLLLAEDYVPGEQQNAAMQRLLHLPENSPERAKMLQELQEIHRKLGLGLAELHLAGNPQIGPLPPALQDYYTRTAINASKVIADQYGQPALADKGLKAFQCLLHNRGCQPLGYTHSDAHWGNYFYDPAAQKIWMIDLTDAAATIGPGQTPAGAPMIDFERLIDGFASWEHWGMTPQESRTLQKAFLAGYHQLNPNLTPDSPEFRLFRLVNAFRFFEWYGANRSHFPKQATDTLDHFIELNLKNIEDASSTR